MKLYLAPKSSLALMRYLRAVDNDCLQDATAMRKRRLIDAINTTHAIDELDETAQRLLRNSGTQIELFIPERSKTANASRLVTHVFNGEMPHGTMLDLGHGMMICAPHFLFTQLAADFDLIDTIRIGMELCGGYSNWELLPPNKALLDAHGIPEDHGCTLGLRPATQTARITNFIKNNTKIRGSVGARAALKWVLDNSASPMETAVYLLLCLPRRLGGYGLPKPVLNPKVVVSNPDGAKERYPDLFWAGKNVDVEYNSDLAHSGEWSRYKDSKREVELTVGNIKVLPLTRMQLMDTDEFDAFAQGLRRMLGVRTRLAGPEWTFRRDELRTRLLKEWL